MNIDKYKRLLKSNSINEISLGYTTIRLFPESELNKAQIGYSFDSNGNSLIENREGGWKEVWFIIGEEDLCGDPIFIDVESDDFAVFTAMHGEGNWNPEKIAETFNGFIKLLELLSKVSKDRNTPILLENNPFSSKEREAILVEIKKNM